MKIIQENLKKYSLFIGLAVAGLLAYKFLFNKKKDLV